MTNNSPEVQQNTTPIYKKMWFSYSLLLAIVGFNLLFSLIFIITPSQISLTEFFKIIYLSSGGGSLLLLSGFLFNYEVPKLLIYIVYLVISALVILNINKKINSKAYLLSIIYLILSLGGIITSALIGY